MFCPECGKKNPDENTFCMFCGEPLISNAPAAPVAPVQNPFPQTPAAPVQQPAQPTQPQPAPAQQPAESHYIGSTVQIDVGAAVNKIKNFDVKAAADSAKQKVNKLSTATKVIIAAVSAVTVAVIAFFIVGSSIYNPERVAKNYFKNYMEADYAAMYDDILFPESDLITEERFVEYMSKNVQNPGGKIIDYEINESAVYDYGWGYGEGQVDDEFNKAYYITYILEGNSYSDSFSVNLSLSGKKMLFFKEYKVSGDPYLAKNIYVYTPQNAVLTIDGVEVAADESYDGGDYNYQKHCVYAILSGNHTLTVSGDIFKEYTTEAYFYSEDELYYTDLELSDKVRASLADKTQAFTSELFAAAASGKSISDFSVSFTSNYDYYDDIVDEYEYLLGKFNADGQTAYSSISPKNFYDESDSAELASGSVYRCEMDFEYDYVKLQYDYWDDIHTEYRSEQPYDGYITVGYELVDGEWLIKYFSISGI